MKRVIIAITLIVITIGNISAQKSESIETFLKIKNEAFNNSGIEEYSFWFTDYMGPRLSASDMYLRAEKVAGELFEKIGLENIESIKEQDFNFQGWDYSKCYIAMTAPYYSNFAAVPAAWCGSTNGSISGSVVYFNAKDKNEIQNYKGQLKGKIVLLPSSNKHSEPHYRNAENRRINQEALDYMVYDTRVSNNLKGSRANRATISTDNATTNGVHLRELRRFAHREGAAAIVYEDGYYNIISGQSPWFYERIENCGPEIAISKEELNRMVRLIEHNVQVDIELQLETTFNGNYALSNLFAEIPGKNKKIRNEYVLIGGHLDSWLGGTGANDNASGCIVAAEAMRILKAIDAKPERTIRIALWNGEEQGILGSAAYAKRIFTDSTAPKNMVLYLNTDNGSGQFRGICLEENYKAIPFFKEWGKAIETLGFTTISPKKSYSTDHTSFVKYGAPAYQFIQDGMGYGISYHTNMDRYERMAIEDMRSNAAIIAWLALNAANDPSRIPYMAQ